MPFHRLVSPTYPGGLPAGYDFLNTPSDVSVGGSGVPTPVSGKKTGGPNDGTYFVAFGEDARATFANRGLSALAQNTDFIDDILRTGIPTISFINATAVGAVTSIALTGAIYVGDSGTTNNQANRNKIVRITDQNDNDIEVSGSKVVATLIHDGSNNNVVGTQATAFRTNATVTVSPAIPNGTAYRVWFGLRNTYTNISTADRSALFEESLRTINNVSAEVRTLFRLVHSEASVNQDWDAAFDSTIRSLASSGLNERYRRATLQPAGFTTGNYNSAGAGAVIRRDGRAVEIQAATNMLIQNTVWKDGNHALLKLNLEDSRSISGAAISGNAGGDFGIWHESEWKPDNSISDAGMFTRTMSAGPALVDVVPYDMRVASFNGDTLLTFINASSATATLNPDSGGGNTARRTVQCGVGQYFALSSPTRTAIRLGVDLLEITDSGGRVRTFVIEQLTSANRVVVAGPAGITSGLFAASAEAGCRIRILQVVTSVGGFLGRDEGGSGPIVSRPLLVFPPAILTTDPDSEDPGPCAFFGAQTGSVVDATGGARRARALEWGSTGNPDSGGAVNGSLGQRGHLNGDGSIDATALRVTNITCEDVDGDDADFDMVRQKRSSQLYVFSEEFINVIQTFTPDIIFTTDHNWQFAALAGTVSLSDGPSSGGNPGVLDLIASGGGVAKRFVMLTSAFRSYSFITLEELTAIVKVTDSPANNLSTFQVVLVDDFTAADNLLGLIYVNGLGWCVNHIRNGSNGTHNFDPIAPQVNDEWVVIRFIKDRVSGDVGVFFNNATTPVVTILSSEMPLNQCTLAIMVEQTIGDANATTWSIDRVDLRLAPGSTRFNF